MNHRYDERRKRAQTMVREKNAEAAIVCPGPNLQYFTGLRGEPFDRYHALYLPADGDCALLSPDGYLSQAEAYADADDYLTIGPNDPDALASTIEMMSSDDTTTLLVDGCGLHTLSQALYQRFSVEEIGPADPIFRSLRRVKDDAEIQALRRSASVADAVSEEIRSLGSEAVGYTEAELATEIRASLHARGAKGVSFDVVVGSGPNGADPALRTSDRQIRSGEPVVVDFGCFLDGYASDQTRTVVFDGDPPADFERAHEATLNALEVGVVAVEPGMEAGEVDAAVRDKLSEYGLADRFTHGTGHGVGLASHESLTIAEDEPTELEPGMVFSIEPGVYYEGEWGVRIEDLVVVTDSGAERLNGTPRTWKPL